MYPSLPVGSLNHHNGVKRKTEAREQYTAPRNYPVTGGLPVRVKVESMVKAAGVAE